MKGFFIFFSLCSFHLFLFPIQIHADVNSTTGNLNFDSDGDGSAEMTLNSTGLGIGVASPSSNLHVLGNAMITNSLSVGTSSGFSSLHVAGTLGLSIETISSNIALSNNSLVMLDSSGGNLFVSLPLASSCNGRIYTVKKNHADNSVILSATGDFIDKDTSLTLPATSSGTLPGVTLVSNGVLWHIINQLGHYTGVASGNLLAHWKFDGDGADSTAIDATGNGYDLSLNSLSFSGCTITGVSGSGLSFDGTDDYAVSAAGGIGDIENFSVLGWVYYPTLNNDGWFDINAVNGLFIRLNNAAVRVSACTNYSAMQNSGDLLKASVWTHIGLTISSNATNSTLSLYIDGHYVSSSTETLINLNNDIVYLGVSQGSRYFEGSLDDVRVYNKTLGAEEVKNIFTSYAELNLAYYPKQFDQWTASSAGTGSTPTVTANFATAPDGTLTAERVQFDLNGGSTTSDQSDIAIDLKRQLFSGTSYTFSVWAWTNDSSSKTIRVRDASSRTTIATNFTIDGTPTKYTFTSTSGSTGTTDFLIRLRGGLGMSDSADVILWNAQLDATSDAGR
jgi:hypothetical protein